MQKYLYLLGSMGIIWYSSVFAAETTDITHTTKKNVVNTEYSTYTVRCSDGSKREITAWNNHKKWCVGTTTEQCTDDQLKTAKQACAAKKL